jgi:formate dehydrogenase subunit gamma
MTASAFMVMALTGLILLYGKPLLIPVIGEGAFVSVASASAWLHMASAVPFVVGILVMIAVWLKDNIPTSLDWEWLKQGGGFLDNGRKPPARKFNAGQKLVFWGVTLGGLMILASGLALMLPFYWFGYDGMQWAQIIHAVTGLCLIVLIIGHIYIGTIGMEGAIDAMWDGDVDRNWAKEHHSLWYERITGRTRSTSTTGQQPSRPAPAE